MSQYPAPPTDKTAGSQSPQDVILYCANHPSVETSLRCNNCSKPICPKCAVLTPTGYRCKECISGQQKVFDTSQWYDYPVAFTVAGLLSLLGSILASNISFFIIFVAPIIGVVIANVVRFLTGKRRSPRLFLLTAVGTALGTVPAFLVALLGLGRSFVPLELLWLGLYAFTVTSSVYYGLRGITMK